MHWNYLRFPQGKGKALSFSYDDGVIQDIRLLELFTAAGVKGTFNLNSGMYSPEGAQPELGQRHFRLPESEATRLYSLPSAEIACHGFDHTHMGELPLAVVTRDFLLDRERLEQQFGTIINGCCYPYGCYNAKVRQAAEAAGLVHGRVCQCTNDFSLPDDLLAWKPTCHHNAPQLMELAQDFCTREVVRDPQLFYVWGHSYEFDYDNNWGIMQDFLDKVSHRDDVWYAGVGEIADYILAYNRLEYSCEGTMVRNPSWQPVWFSYDFQLVCVPPGECIRLGLPVNSAG